MKTMTEKEDIKAWLIDHDITDYILIENAEYGWVINTQYSVALDLAELRQIPVKFGFVGGNFDLRRNHLTNLKGCPDVVQGSFNANHNILTSLEGAPHTIGKNFSVYNNRLENLLGAPKKVGHNFIADKNKLVTLSILPEEIGGSITLSDNIELGIYQNLTQLCEIVAMREKSQLDSVIPNQIKNKICKL